MDLKWTLLALHYFLEDVKHAIIVRRLANPSHACSHVPHINISKTCSNRAKCLIDSDPLQHYWGKVLCREPSNQPCADLLAFVHLSKHGHLVFKLSPTKNEINPLDAALALSH